MNEKFSSLPCRFLWMCFPRSVWNHARVAQGPLAPFLGHVWIVPFLLLMLSLETTLFLTSGWQLLLLYSCLSVSPHTPPFFFLNTTATPNVQCVWMTAQQKECSWHLRMCSPDPWFPLDYWASSLSFPFHSWSSRWSTVLQKVPVSFVTWNSHLFC